MTWIIGVTPTDFEVRSCFTDFHKVKTRRIWWKMVGERKTRQNTAVVG
jgi:hypothetical protein